MANNRFYLVHEPSKTYICLGRHMVGGWYGAPSEERIQKFYDYTYEWSSENACDWERLSLFMESNLTKDYVPFSAIKETPKKKDGAGYIKYLMGDEWCKKAFKKWWEFWK